MPLLPVRIGRGDILSSLEGWKPYDLRGTNVVCETTPR